MVERWLEMEIMNSNEINLKTLLRWCIGIELDSPAFGIIMPQEIPLEVFYEYVGIFVVVSLFLICLFEVLTLNSFTFSPFGRK